MSLLGVSLVSASGLVISASLERSTFLPYEPIYVGVKVANRSSSLEPIPRLTNEDSYSILRFTIVSDLGERLMGPAHGGGLIDVPFWYGRTLASGESCEVEADLAYYSGKRDLESPDGENFCIPPGRYTVRVSWNMALVPPELSVNDESSNTLGFTVRAPDSTEAKALRIYRDLHWWARPSYSLWKKLHGTGTSEDWDLEMMSNVERLFGEMLRSCPVMPYILLAKLDLAKAVHAWLADCGPQTVGSSFRDSLRTLCKDIGLNYPDSPIAAHFIGRSVYLRNLDGEQAHAEFLAELVKRNPESMVGLAAAELLRAKSK
jgi:hypothetical protein